MEHKIRRMKKTHMAENTPDVEANTFCATDLTWYGHPVFTTRDPRKVTCKRCLRVMLANKLHAIRKKYIEEGGKLYTSDEIDAEISKGRKDG